MDPAPLSILLLLLGITFIVLELFIPSGGVLGCIAAVSLVGSVLVAFAGRGMTFGTIMLVVNVVVTLVVIPLTIRIWPHTPFGRAILIGKRDADDVLPDDEEYQVLKTLVGRQGKARTKMLPSGMVVIDGKEYDAVSVGVPIEKGQRIQVVSLQTNHIVVRPASENEPQEKPVAEEDVLARPLDSLGIDPFDEDPLA